MTIPFQKGRYVARFATSAADVTACHSLRHAAFFRRPGRDVDSFDADCRHLMVVGQTGRVVAVLRLWLLPDGTAANTGYTAQYYDLAGFAKITEPVIELGRLCVAADVRDGDVLRVLWGALTRLVDAENITLLFGCTSFAGTDPHDYGRVFAQLAAFHLGPPDRCPKPRTPEAVAFAQLPAQGTRPLPSVLRSYLAMGAWVGDHVVVDRQMNTQHVFTCVDIAAVPPARARILRAIAS
ncbi:GNAT family N-acetyltransferase [Yoonia sp.]|uniref:GNAT family N-acetyltransferase n=1 Tax=Yoonia sp. TaxID=2212373 RepID=UPI0019DF07B2|nr:GNAT family N-acetyltransferase [Yoonia sp.]MBE0412854.1 GNAT family N-acetyltransferase [Yoonia sp.]